MNDINARRAERWGDLTSAGVAALDAAAVRSGVDVLQLMEVAGWQVARCAWRLLGRRPGSVAVVAGRGNNGGDGAVAARHLASWGCGVRLLLTAPEQELRGPLAQHVVSARNSGAHIEPGDAPLTPDACAGAQLVVDALLGTGLRGAPRERDAAAIDAMRDARVLAVDVPSGLDATSGEPFAACVAAAATCTLTAMKRGLWTKAGRRRAGTLYVADIGMPSAAWRDAGLPQPEAVRGGVLVRIRTDA